MGFSINLFTALTPHSLQELPLKGVAMAEQPPVLPLPALPLCSVQSKMMMWKRSVGSLCSDLKEAMNENQS